jgi:hypothetical protein
MPGKNKYPLIGAHLEDADLVAWVRDEATRRGTTIKEILTEALSAYRASMTCSTDSARAVTKR